MCRVLVVDDESLIREWLVMCLILAGISPNDIQEAKNGEEALRLLDIQNYDCIFTDITMPQLDGMELIKRIRMKDAEVKIFILTCHDDFSFARKAVKYNVSEYLLKNELSKKDIAQLIRKAMNTNLKSEFKRRDTESYIRDLLQTDNVIKKEDLEKYQIAIHCPYFVLAIPRGNFDIKRIQAVRTKYSENIDCFFDGISKILIVSDMTGSTGDYSDAVKLLKNRVADLFGNEIIIGKSKLYTDSLLLKDSFKEAVYNWEKRFFGIEIDVNTVPFFNSGQNSSLKQQAKNMGGTLILQYGIVDRESILVCCEKLYDFFVEYKLLDSEFFKRSIIDILEVIETKVEMNNEGAPLFIAKILYSNSWEEMKTYIGAFLDGIIEAERYNESIKTAKQYIVLHYNEPITLSDRKSVV